MAEFNFDTSYYFSSLDNLNRECKNYTNSESKYQELRLKYENEIYNKALDDFIQYAYIKGIDFSFMGRTMENGESDVPARLKKIKDDFLEQKKGTEENG